MPSAAQIVNASIEMTTQRGTRIGDEPFGSVFFIRRFEFVICLTINEKSWSHVVVLFDHYSRHNSEGDYKLVEVDSTELFTGKKVFIGGRRRCNPVPILTVPRAT